MDPYRSGSQIGTCPRCRGELAGDGELRMVCLAGCGAWYPRELIDHRVRWAEVSATAPVATSWPWGAIDCPSCRCAMTVGFRDELRFDRCDAHGVWLDTGEDVRFFELFARGQGGVI